ncbi:MAG: hypothetical protein ABI091_08220 [Ferruginibacter sp.]
MEKKLKHLDFLQLVITRMNVNSFLLKGWTVTLVSALFAFAAKDSNTKYVIITYISTPIFWLLDAYYLSLERQYRNLYDVVRLKLEDEIDFNLNAKTYNTGSNKWSSSIFSITLLVFYGTIILITIIIMNIIN